jgi:hypothetical protein
MGFGRTGPEDLRSDQALSGAGAPVAPRPLPGVEPHAYLANVISRIVNGHPQARIDDLLPWQYPVTPQLQSVA